MESVRARRGGSRWSALFVADFFASDQLNKELWLLLGLGPALLAIARARRVTPPVRVLMLLDLLEPRSGGGERVAVGLAAHLPRDRFDVGAVRDAARCEAPWDEVLRESGVRVVRARAARVGGRAAVRAARAAAAARAGRRRCTRHMFGSNVWGTVVGRAARVPVVVAHEQTWDYEGQPLRNCSTGG